jgi:hypothetical protein
VSKIAAPPAPRLTGAAQIFAANGYTAARIRELAARHDRNRPLVERLADELAQLEAAS